MYKTRIFDMKKIIITLALAASFGSYTKACGWYDPDYDYFNLFSQSIIKDKAYVPFLLVYSSAYYSDKDYHVHDDNIEAWQKFFGHSLNYEETETLVKKMPLQVLNTLKTGTATDPLLKKLGNGFYAKYQEGIDYLLEAKYLEPYMAVDFRDTNGYFSSANTDIHHASDLDYDKTIAALTSLYNAAKNPEIKLRYGYQLVRFNHYTLNFDKAVNNFNTLVAPLKVYSAPYYLAQDQYAGALRGLNKGEEANWNFFQVFMKSKSRKESVYTSMKLSDSAAFKNIMSRAQTPEEKNMAYFLLAYEGYSDPIPLMEKMYDIDPNSEILKVLASRSINELERSYLPTNYYNRLSEDANNNKSQETKSTESKTEEKKESFWDKVVNWFKRLFGGSSEAKPGEANDLSDKDLLNNPNRIPFFTKEQYENTSEPTKDYIDNLGKFTSKTKGKSTDEFWAIADAYIKFLQKNYDDTKDILGKIKTTNPEYLDQIKRLQVLTDITSQPRIDADFENKIMRDYKDYFVEKPAKKDSANVYEDEFSRPNTSEFLRDVLANRYFQQGEDGKSYLMNNKLSEIQYNPNADLVKKIEVFYKKANKTEFEKEIISKNMNDVGDIDAFFNNIYGDQAMRNADFANAKKFYEKAKNFSGIKRDYYGYDENGNDIKTLPNGSYDGFNDISKLVFGHNKWESFGSAEDETMIPEPFVNDFTFIKDNMNKIELCNIALELQKIASGKDGKASQANQLLGNLLYNTSILGYFRELFVMDIDNSNGGKYDFARTASPFQYYYKNYNYSTFIKPDNFDLSMNYYNKALNLSNNKEQKARIVFQLASAEQGKYYQWEAKQADVPYGTTNWEEAEKKRIDLLESTKRKDYRKYFAMLKNQYGDTQTSKDLNLGCSYYSYFLKQ